MNTLTPILLFFALLALANNHAADARRAPFPLHAVSRFHVVRPAFEAHEGVEDGHLTRVRGSGDGDAVPRHVDEREVEVRLEGGRSFRLRLRKNHALFAPGFVLHENSVPVRGFEPEHCYYTAEVVGEPGSFAALSTCGGGLEGGIHAEDGHYVIHPAARYPGLREGHTLHHLHRHAAAGVPELVLGGGVRADTPVHGGALGEAAAPHVVVRLRDAIPGGEADRSVDCGGAHDEAHAHAHAHGGHGVAAKVAAAAAAAGLAADARASPRAAPFAPPRAPAGARRTLKATYHAELLLVNDIKSVIDNGDGDVTQVTRHTFEIANGLTLLMGRVPEEAGDIVVTLVAVDNWSSEATQLRINGELPVFSNTLTQYLDAFRDWSFARRESDTLGHDVAHLITGTNMETSVAGRAAQSAVCSPSSAAVVEDLSTHSTSTVFTYITSAHEMGHNFGSGHDGVSDSCASSGFIMANSLSITFGTSTDLQWSECSSDEIRSKLQALDESDSSCLDDEPRAVLGTAPHCGDFIVDDGEDCDVALTPLLCTDECTFKDGVVCSSGPCCTASGRFRAAGAECDNSIGPCDLPDMCNGTSSECPSAEIKPDGTPCETEDFPNSRCYGGVCTGAGVQCFETYQQYSDSGGPLHLPCAANNACDELECYRTDEEERNCYVDRYDSGLIIRVLDGTPCVGSGECATDGACMCQSRVCAPRPNDTTPCPDCGENGQCAQSGACVCNPGWTGALCDEVQDCSVDCASLNREECVGGVSSACGSCLAGFAPSLLDGDEINTPCLFEVPDLDSEIVDRNTFPGYDKLHAFDRNVETRWIGQIPARNTSTSATPGAGDLPSLAVHYSGAFRMVHYKLVSATNEAGADPYRWTVYGAEGRGEPWVEIDSRAAHLFSSRAEEAGFTVRDPGSYSSYMMEIEWVAGVDSEIVQVAELGFFRTVPDGSNVPEENTGGGGGSNSGAIAAAVLIPLLLILAAVAGGWYYYRRRKAEDAAASWRWRAHPAANAGVIGGAGAGVGGGAELDRPALFVAQPAPEDSALPDGYSQHVDDSGNVYFFNSHTQTSSWERPV